MDFSWTEEQLALKSEIIEFAKKELNSNVEKDDAACRFPQEKWKKCAEFGILGIAIPDQYKGGRGTDILSAVLAMEGLGYGCKDNGLAFALNGQLCIQLPIVDSGNDAQKQTYLPKMCSGELLGAFAFTEAESGSDLYSIRTQARKCEGGYTIKGEKKFISFAPIANIALLFATINPEMGKWGLTAFLVDTNTKNLRIGPAEDKMGLRTVPLGAMTLDDCFVPEECRLGPEGGGLGILNNALQWERCCSLASQLGAMERQLEECVQYAKKRHQFGAPIGSFQAVSNRIADMKVRLEASRLLLYKVSWLKKMGKTAMLEAALSKLYLSESFVQSSLDAIRIHGGRGYMSEMGIERNLRDAIGSTIYGGTSDIQRNTIAKMLGV